MTPILKWAGGKRKLVDAIIAYTGRDFDTYIEPFLGGGAMLLALEKEHAICSDINGELVNFYHIVRDDVEGLIAEINDNYIPNHSQEFFYHIRGLDRDIENFALLTPTQRAARFIYLNKTCYNGLWRVNRQGFNNVPWGNHVRLNLWDENNLLEVHRYLANNDVEIIQSDYQETARMAQPGDFVYFDPPYDNVRQAGFVDYSAGGFTRDDQTELRDLCNELVDRGVSVAVSNSDTDFIRELFDDARYVLHDDIQALRSIGSRAADRQFVTELLVVG